MSVVFSGDFKTGIFKTFIQQKQDLPCLFVVIKKCGISISTFEGLLSTFRLAVGLSCVGPNETNSGSFVGSFGASLC